MSNGVILEQVEQLAIRLPPREQLKLVAHIGERLSGLLLPETDEERQHREYTAQVEAFLAACDEVAEQILEE